MRQLSEKKYYQVLGVPETADEEQIRKAYRKLAKKYHPDSNQGNAAAEQKFKEISQAYDVLGNPEKKALYDRYGEMGLQEGFDPEQYAAHENDAFGSDWDDIFSGLFGHGAFRGRTAPAKGRDVQSDLTVSFDEAVLGCDKTLRVQEEDGSIRTLQVHIPAGIDDGKQVRLAGKGMKGAGGTPGDLYLMIHVTPRKGYERKGQDLYVTTFIPYTTAVLGGEARIHLPGGTVSCRIPPGSRCGSKIRLRGRGVASVKNPSVKGDAYVVIQIDVPAHLTPGQERALRDYAKAS